MGSVAIASIVVLKHVAIFFAAGAAFAAEPEAEVKAALRSLGATSYSWETTVRQRSSGEAANLSLNPTAPLEVTGRADPDSYTELVILPSRQTVDAPVMAVIKFGDAVAHTPLGWIRRTEIREAQAVEKDRMVPFEGKSVRLSRSLSTALRATSTHTPLEEALDMIAEVKSYRAADGYLIGDLRDRVIEELWGEARAKNAPEIAGHLIFKITDNVLAEYHVLLAIGFPNSKTRKVAWSVQQWTTRIKGVGTTNVTPPAAAAKKLEE